MWGFGRWKILAWKVEKDLGLEDGGAHHAPAVGLHRIIGIVASLLVALLLVLLLLVLRLLHLRHLPRRGPADPRVKRGGQERRSGEEGAAEMIGRVVQARWGMGSGRC